MEKKNINDTDIIDDIETEERLIRPTYTKALGKINKYSQEEIVEKGLADDEKLLTEVFKMFNNEFYDGKLSEPVIHISSAVRGRTGIKITDKEEWVKRDDNKSEKCKGLYIADRILRIGSTVEGGMKEAYVLLAVGMIYLYDSEMRNSYAGGNDIRSDKEKAEDEKKGSKSKDRKKAYKGMITRGGTYFTEEFANECKRIGIIATPRKEEPGKYNLVAGELFIQVLEKYNLLDRKFICAMIPKDKDTGNVRTYQCPICELNVRGTKSGLRIKCCSKIHPDKEPLMKELKEEEEKERREKREKEVRERAIQREEEKQKKREKRQREKEVRERQKQADEEEKRRKREKRQREKEERERIEKAEKEERQRKREERERIKKAEEEERQRKREERERKKREKEEQ